MSLNQSLPSPNSRRNQDPSNRALPRGMTPDVGVNAGHAAVTLPQVCSFTGVPLCVLTGGTHAVPLYPNACTPTGLTTAELTFTENVVPGDVITWPAKDEAIRAKNGAYIANASYTVAGTIGTAPVELFCILDYATLTVAITFDQDVMPIGPSIGSRVALKTAGSVPFRTGEITDITGTVVTATVVFEDNALGDATATSNNLGTVLAGVIGGIPAQDFTAAGITTINDDAPPQVINSFKVSAGADYITYLVFSMPVSSLPATGNVQTSDDTTQYTNPAPASGVNGFTVQATTGNNIGPGAAPNTCTATVPVVESQSNATDNAPFIDYPCPTV